MVAALAMSLSSVTVVSNALRLKPRVNRTIFKNAENGGNKA